MPRTNYGKIDVLKVYTASCHRCDWREQFGERSDAESSLSIHAEAEHESGTCVCGKPIPSAPYSSLRKYCTRRCFYKARREDRKSKGLCPDCGVGAPHQGRLKCEKCLNNQAAYYAKRTK